MKIQCSVCESAEARVLCCADEAALCMGCDEKVHAANKLAGKHQRVSLSSSSSKMPKCDICQETVGFFFCLEDRALLCRKCDVAIHSVNNFVSAHQRFLLTGVKVGLEANEPVAVSSSAGKSYSVDKISETKSCPSSRKVVSESTTGQVNRVVPVEVDEFAPAKLPFGGGTTAGGIQQWQFDELLGLTDLNQNYGYMDQCSSKADSGKLGESDNSPILRALEMEPNGEEYLGQVPDSSSLAVPEMNSPPTSTGLYWPKDYQHQMDTPAFVPDVSYTTMQQNSYHPLLSGATLKKRRNF